LSFSLLTFSFSDVAVNLDWELRAYMVFLNHKTKLVKASFVDKWSMQVLLMKCFHNSNDYSMAQINKFDQVVTHLKFQELTVLSQTEWSRIFKLLRFPPVVDSLEYILQSQYYQESMNQASLKVLASLDPAVS